MTTWEDNGYRFNLSQIIARYTKFKDWQEITAKIDDSLSGGTAGDYVFPPAVDGKDLSNNSFYQKIFCHSVKARKINSEQKLLVDICKRAKTIKIGMQAIYHVYEILVNKDSNNIPEIEFSTDLLRFYEHTMKLAGASSYNQEANVGPYVETALKVIRHSLDKYGKIHRAVQQMMTQHRNKIYRDRKKRWQEGFPYPTYEQDVGLREFHILHASGCMILYTGPHSRPEHIYVLDYASQTRLYQLSASMMYTHMYCNIYSKTGKQYNIISAAEKYFDHMITNMSVVTSRTAQLLCKGYKKSYDVFLAILAGKANANSARFLLNEYENSELNEIVNVREVLKIMYSVNLSNSMEIARLFKVLPAPDYDMGQAFAELYKKHMNPVPHVPLSVPYQPKNDKRPVEIPTMQGLRLYMRYFWISYHAEVKRQSIGTVKPQYMDEDWVQDYMTKAKLPHVTDLSWTDKIDLSSTAPYIEDSEDSILNLKDKILAYDTLEENMTTPEPEPMMRSQVTRLLIDSRKSNFLPQPNMIFEHVHRVAPKPEAHKDIPRLFFMGNLKGRRTLAELEHNIGWVCRELPGYAIGKSTSEIKTKMHELAIIPEGYGAIFLNTDVEGWSPKMNGVIQQMTMDFWAEVFGKPELSEYTKIWFDSEIVMNKAGFIAHYKNNKANFEGYNGKMLTYMHLCVIAYATRIARQTVPEISPANILAFIDDVAARVIVSKEHLERVTPVYYESLNAVYEAVGLKLDKFKSILSNHLSIFLNEIYVAGSHLTYGSRAAVRMGTIIRDQTDTMVDMIEASRAATEGIIKAGAPHYNAYSLFLVSLAWLHYKWDPNAPLTNTKFAFFQFVPRILGGYGIPTILGVATNLNAHPLTEGLAVIQEICYLYPDFKTLFHYAVSGDLVQKTEAQILLGPNAVSSNRAILNNGRIGREIEKAIEKYYDRSAIADVLMATKRVNINDFAKEMLAVNPVIDAHSMMKFVAATPFDLIRSVSRKFQSSQSIKNVIGSRAVTRISRASKIDVLKVNAKIRKL
jgi:hypothetical protein